MALLTVKKPMQQSAPTDTPTGSKPGVNAADPQSGQAMLPSQRVTQITKTGSPILTQAQTYGQQYGQRRGLLNSSITAGAAQGAVLDRAIQLAQADTQADLANRQLDQQKALETRRLDIDEKIRTFQNELDQRRLESDEAYRNKALAQQAALEREKQELTRDLDANRLKFERERLSQEKTLTEKELKLRETVHDETLDLETKKFEVEKTLKEFYQDLDEKKFEYDKVYRNEKLRIEDQLLRLKKTVDMAAMNIAERQARLAEDSFDFYSKLDRDKFVFDKEYRTRVQDHVEWMGKEQMKVERLRLGVQATLDSGRLTNEERRGYLTGIQLNNDQYMTDMQNLHLRLANGDITKDQFDKLAGEYRTNTQRKNDYWREIYDYNFKDDNGDGGGGGGGDNGDNGGGGGDNDDETDDQRTVPDPGLPDTGALPANPDAPGNKAKPATTFPKNPTNGDRFTINGVEYEYKGVGGSDDDGSGDWEVVTP